MGVITNITTQNGHDSFSGYDHIVSHIWVTTRHCVKVQVERKHGGIFQWIFDLVSARQQRFLHGSLALNLKRYLNPVIIGPSQIYVIFRPKQS